MRGHGLLIDTRQTVPAIFVWFQLHQSLGTGRDIGQRIVDLVTGSVCQLFQRSEFLGLQSRLKLRFMVLIFAGYLQKRSQC